MNRRTAQALNRINLEFYDEHGEEFALTRRRPWPGWGRVIERLERRLQLYGRQRASILDLGCGNGRLAAFLADRLPLAVSYRGVDSSRRLLTVARSWQPARRGWSKRFICADLVANGLASITFDSAFDLVAVFGLLHHVPGFERRRKLLREAAGLVRPGGMLALTFWQFGTSQRFLRRVIAWQDFNRRASEEILLEELEPGDMLLAWGESGAGRKPTSRRYCHYADSQEADRLTGSLGLSEVETFTADGEDGTLNLYHLLERRG